MYPNNTPLKESIASSLYPTGDYYYENLTPTAATTAGGASVTTTGGAE